MLSPLAILLAGSLMLPIADPAQVKGCSARKPFKTEIQIDLDIPETRYDFSMTRKNLTEGQVELTTAWKSEHEDHVWASSDLSVEGLARGGMGVMSASQFIGVPYDKYGMYYCPYVKKLIVSVHYNTKIFVAREHKKGTCDFSATLAHEEQHHQINVDTVSEVMMRLEKDLPEIISYMERRYVPRAEVENGAMNLQAGLEDALKIYSEHMFKEMSKRNAVLDSPEEYQRVAAQCPR